MTAKKPTPQKKTASIPQAAATVSNAPAKLDHWTTGDFFREIKNMTGLFYCARERVGALRCDIERLELFMTSLQGNIRLMQTFIDREMENRES